MTGLERLDSLMLKITDNNIIRIVDYLRNLKNIDFDLFLNIEKCPEEMWKYICDKAKEHAINNVSIIEDQTVYNWSLDYWQKSNEDLGIVKDTPIHIPKVKSTETTPTISSKEQLSLF